MNEVPQDKTPDIPSSEPNWEAMGAEIGRMGYEQLRGLNALLQTPGLSENPRDVAVRADLLRRVSEAMLSCESAEGEAGIRWREAEQLRVLKEELGLW
ncbi:hypothetical protein JW766_01485 [Candidatus Dojkabacteria bacterium]|nr:hypothetical protein [Candidatus Dojkabacteria bacterium]